MTLEQILWFTLCFFIYSWALACCLLLAAAWCWAVWTLGKSFWRIFHAR